MQAPRARAPAGKAEGAAAAARAGAPPQAARGPHSIVGNLALQQHLRAGALRAKLQVGAPNDPAEAEADRLAEQALASPGRLACTCGAAGCPKCSGSSTMLRRKPAAAASGGGNRAIAAAFGARRGRPLDGAMRARFETHFGDLSDVRIHDDAAAAATADAIGARAFTAGSQIGFAEGEFAPATERGRRLLGHELAHVAQDRRQEDDEVRREPTPQGRTQAQGQGQVGQGGTQPQTQAANVSGEFRSGVLGYQTDFDPCAMNEKSLSNYALVAQLQATATYLRARKRGQDRYYDYANLMRRMAAERARRIGMGHIWLGDVSSSFPSTLYQLHASDNGSFTVTLATASQQADAPADISATPLMTPGQFNQLLERNHIPQVDVEGFYRLMAEHGSKEQLQLTAPPPRMPPAGPADFYDLLAPPRTSLWGNAGVTVLPTSGALVSPFDIFARPNLTRNVYSPRVNMANPRSTAGAELNWRGGLPEQAFGRGSYADIWTYTDLNRIRRNFEVLDFAGASGTGDLVSVTHSAAGSPDWYGDKFSRMTGGEQPAKFNTAMTRLNTAFGTSLTVADINQRNMLAVPDDHIPLAQAEVNRIVTNEPQRVAPMLDTLLQAPGGGVSVGGTTYTSWNQVQAARSSGSLNPADYSALLGQLAPRAQQRVVGIGMTLPEIMEMQRIRIATQSFRPGQFSAVAPPEVLEVRRIMATGVPENEAISIVARGSARRGAIGGTGVAVAMGGIQYLASGADPRVGRDVLLGLPAQAAGGYLGGFSQAQWNARLAGPVLNEAVAGGATSVAARGAVIRIGGGGVIGGPLAALTMWGQMGIQELAGTADYTDIDYLSLGTRAGVAGGIAGMASEAGALGFAAYCAAAGTPEAPGVGTAIGFGVGLVTYFVVDWAYGDEIEAAAREALGEKGCVGR